MSITDAQLDRATWCQKSAHRPVLRMPLHVPSSPNLAAPVGAHARASPTSSSTSTSPSVADLAVSSPLILSLDGERRTVKDTAEARREPSNVVTPPPDTAEQHAPSLPSQMDASLSASVTAREQLRSERKRLMEGEHDALRNTLQRRMQHIVAASTPAAAEGSQPPSSAAPSPRPAPSASSSSSHVTTTTAAKEDATAQEKYVSAARGSSASPSVHATEDRTLRTPYSPSLDSLSRAVPQPHQSSENNDNNGTLLLPPAAAAAGRENERKAEMQSSPPTRRPNATANTTATPFHMLPNALHAQQQPEQEQQRCYQLSLQQLQHDVQHCASEIERLVEDQYNLRCALRDALLHFAQPTASPPSEAIPLIPAAAAGRRGEEPEAVPCPAEEQENPIRSGSGSTSASSSDSPGALPSWLVTWLHQLQSEQGDSFQRLREEMMVLVCHAVAEMRHTSASSIAAVTEAVAAHHNNYTPAKNDEHGQQHSRAPSTPSASSQRSTGAAAMTVAAAATPPVNVVTEAGISSRYTRRADEPPPSLLWQRYRRLMSPTPPNQLDIFSPSRAPSDASLSVRAQDALWSALLQMQRVVKSQSAQIAALTERLSQPVMQATQAGAAAVVAEQPPRQLPHQQRHQYQQRASLDSSVVSADTSFNTSVSSDSTPSPPRRHNNHHHTHPRTAAPAAVSALPPSHRSSDSSRQRAAPELAALHTEIRDLRHLLSTTLQQQRETAVADGPRSVTAVPASAPYRHHRDVMEERSLDSDRRSSAYARRQYAPAAAASPAHTQPERHTLQSEDTRYARGVMSGVPQQQQQRHSPNARVSSRQSHTPPSPYVSPIQREWRVEEEEEGGYNAAVGQALRTPPELPRRRVRTMLTSSLVHPPA